MRQACSGPRKILSKGVSDISSKGLLNKFATILAENTCIVLLQSI